MCVLFSPPSPQTHTNTHTSRTVDKRTEADHSVRVPGAGGEFARHFDAVRPVDGGENAGRRERNRAAIRTGRRPGRPQRQGNYRLSPSGEN